MDGNYKIVYKGGEGEIEEKKSRFIATLRPVNSEEEALNFIAEMKKKFRDASHNCFAFTIGEKEDIVRAGDDGEPAQTAGRPMLEVLQGEGLHDVCVVVTRYFGGTLLGTGGLVRAYQKAVKQGLLHSVVVEKCPAERIKVETDYTDLGKIQYILGEAGISVVNSEYSDKVIMTILVPQSETVSLQGKLTEGTSGRCRMETTDHLYYGLIGKQIVLF